ncbi:helix-turn-helix domain-containing protein [Micromonospora sp. WMMD1102]|uniref:helix-turn-helix domain-containing protein n=1 Tax=Micromonospora sp. WMMD1102 TaxID=3016105 RepID=UPI002414ED6C|nr:helix-turn-helix domain-containing protein [Micromonospora sp. WMMD1102]MDG4787130.1 helix-turn-helix domain-containing protein [Micromonospora sp. WMMD1102]
MSTPPPHTFAHHLRALFAERTNPRTGEPYTNAEVAKSAGLSKTQIGNLLKGDGNPTYTTIQALATFFGVNPDYFFGGDAGPDPELRAAMQDLGVRRIAHRSIGISEGSQEMVLGILERIRQLERGPTPAPGTDADS